MATNPRCSGTFMVSAFSFFTSITPRHWPMAHDSTQGFAGGIFDALVQGEIKWIQVVWISDSPRFTGLTSVDSVFDLGKFTVKSGVIGTMLCYHEVRHLKWPQRRLQHRRPSPETARFVFIMSSCKFAVNSAQNPKKGGGWWPVNPFFFDDQCVFRAPSVSTSQLNRKSRSPRTQAKPVWSEKTLSSSVKPRGFDGFDTFGDFETVYDGIT